MKKIRVGIESDGEADGEADGVPAEDRTVIFEQPVDQAGKEIRSAR